MYGLWRVRRFVVGKIRTISKCFRAILLLNCVHFFGRVRGRGYLCGRFPNFYTEQRAYASHGNDCQKISECADPAADTKL